MELNEKAKILNYMIARNKFENRDTSEYLYASLSQPPIKIIDKCNSNDELDYIVECPNCGNHVVYGEHIYMLSGYIYCDSDGCREELLENNQYLKEKYFWWQQ